MKVINAQAMGMCFGVKDALATVMTMDHPERATVYGQLVHNGEVLKRIKARGFSTLEESDRTPAVSTPNVVITAHGLSDKERRTLEASGKTLIDTTCPLVSRVHQIARDLHAPATETPKIPGSRPAASSLHSKSQCAREGMDCATG